MAYLSYLLLNGSKPVLRKNPMDGQKYLRQNDEWVKDLSITLGRVTSENSTVSLDCSTGNMFKINLTSNSSLELKNPPIRENEAYVANILVENDGEFTMTFPSDWRFPNGEIPVITANGMDEIVVTCYPDGRITCSISPNFKF